MNQLTDFGFWFGWMDGWMGTVLDIMGWSGLSEMQEF